MVEKSQIWIVYYGRCDFVEDKLIEPKSVALIGIECGLLKGLDTLRWALAEIQNFAEVSAVSSVVQCEDHSGRLILRIAAKVLVDQSPENIVGRLKDIETDYDEKIKLIESARCFLLAYDQLVVITPQVNLPHPQLIDNNSWLYCCSEVWKNYRHPVLDLTIERLLDQKLLSKVEFFSQGKVIVSKSGSA